jgi:hypothetical protein
VNFFLNLAGGAYFGSTTQVAFPGKAGAASLAELSRTASPSVRWRSGLPPDDRIFFQKISPARLTFAEGIRGIQLWRFHSGTAQNQKTKNKMNKFKRAIVTAFLALAAVFAGNAKAEDLKEGVRYKFTLSGATLYAKLSELKDGVATVEIDAGQYLTAASSEEGAAVKGGPKAKANKWKLIDNGGVWNFVHAENGANALSMGGVSPKGEGKPTGELKLRRNNAGGAGNKDQLWKFEGEAK